MHGAGSFMTKLFKYMRAYRKEAILAPVFKMLEALFDLLVPLVIRILIDTGIAGHNRACILQMGGLLVLLAAVGLAMAVTAQYFAAKAATGFTARIRSALFAHIQSLSYTELDTLGTSTMETRLTSDMNQVQSGTNLALRLLLRSPFIVFGSMILAFTIDVREAVIFVIVIPVLMAVVFGIMLVCIPLYRKVQKSLDRVTGLTRENLAGVRVIRAFGRAAQETGRFNDANESLNDLQKFVGKISAALNPVTFVIINIASLVLIWTGAWRVDSGALTQGAVIALVNYMSQILVELIKFADLVININRSVACGNRIQAVMEMKSSMEDGAGVSDNAQASAPDSSVPAVQFDHVSLRYHASSEDAVSEITLTVPHGSTVGMIGGTGSGKSTVVSMIPRYYDATGGRVLVDGRDVRDYRISDLRAKIGYVPQKAVLFSGTIADNLRWGRQDATEEDMWEALRIAQAEDFVREKPGGLSALVEQGGRNFSGGQRQRLTIARALISRPEILILDDSASALDFATDAKLRKAIREMKNSPAVFIVSQRAASMLYADQILVLDDGRPAGLGTSDELLKSCTVYREIYETQFEKRGGD